MSAGPVVLVGLMGSGKSTVGPRLAARLGRPFVDADEAVEARAGQPVREIFAGRGEAAFRALEAEVLAELLAGGPSVVAAGGGAVVTEANRRALARPDVTVVWLDGSPAFLASRIAGDAGRPLLHGDEPAAAVLARLAEQRRPWYEEVADIRIDIDPSSPASTADGGLVATIEEAVLAREGAAA